jgi:hypothetical protein
MSEELKNKVTVTEFTKEEEELMMESGFGQDFDGKTKEERQEFFKDWINIQLDRGEDIQETNATFHFVSKKYNETEKKLYNVDRGNFITGTIIAIRTQLKSKFDIEPRFSSSEFNPFKKEEQIVLFGEDSKVFEGTYKEIKEEYTTVSHNRDGSIKKKESDYNYFINIYIDAGDKKYKLMMKGYDRSQWFDFNKTLKRADLLSHNVGISVVEAPRGLKDKMVKCIGFVMAEPVEIKDTLAKMTELKEFFYKAPKKDDDTKEVAVEAPTEQQAPQAAPEEELPTIQLDEDGIENSEFDPPTVAEEVKIDGDTEF